MKFTTAIMVTAITANVTARHHHHQKELLETDEQSSLSSETKLITSLRTTLDQALLLEARDDKAGAVAKTAAIKNI